MGTIKTQTKSGHKTAAPADPVGAQMKRPSNPIHSAWQATRGHNLEDLCLERRTSATVMAEQKKASPMLIARSPTAWTAPAATAPASSPSEASTVATTWTQTVSGVRLPVEFRCAVRISDRASSVLAVG
jgi:hypothetical protein